MKHKNSLLGEGVTSPPELSKRVFVPLCGKAVDMLWLAACGHRVYGVDLSGVAARDFFDRAGLPRTTTPADAMVTERWSAGVKRVHTSGNIAIVEGDLFSIRPDPDPRPDEDDVRPGWFGVIPRGDELGGSIITRSSSAVANEDAADSSSALDARVGAQGSISFREEALRFASGGGPAMDAVWDRGALVAVEPSLRDRYASSLAARLAPGGRMLVVSVSYDPNAGCAGPPHNVPHEELVRLYESRGCEVTLLGSEEVIETAPPRMREKISSMTESAYLVRKPHRRGKGGFNLPRPRL
uniref:Thiopurine S-methyltransferase n=1 Tax=Micromonas pusilla TaxID=38833 RepID=A0A7S0PMV1_MICPS|mmetsp:Transcript_12816/g.50050  ORF Transcript_12816/g.50050 Transcript_12816/m.50050 type:complete len:297 (+) Transcript_12816:836-1726(+)